MDRLFQLTQIGAGQGVDDTPDPSGLLGGGQLGGALARLGGGGPTPGQGYLGGSSDGFAPGSPGDPATAQAAAMNPLLAGLASWGTDQKIQQEANEVLKAKGIDGNGGSQPQSAPGGGQQDVGQLVETLKKDYDNAKARGANLTTQTETLARKALEGEEQQNQDQQAGGADGGAGGAAGPSGGEGAGGSNGAGGAGGAGSAGGGGGQAPMAISQDAKTGSLTADASKMLDSALQGDKNFDNVFSQFGQGTEGNCAAVACIKAAMDVYDNKVFDQVTKGDDGSYTIKMQDGQEVKVSAAELGQAAKASNFDGPDSEAKSYAIMSYAAMAKRAQMEGHEGARSYTQALNSLADGDNPYDSARFLGLKNQTQQVDPTRANGGNAVVGWNSTHAVYIDSTSQGTKTDHYGKATSYDGTDTRGGRLTSGFTFRPRANSSASSSNSTTTTSRSSAPSAGSSSSSSPSRPSSSSTSSTRTTSTSKTSSSSKSSS